MCSYQTSSALRPANAADRRAVGGCRAPGRLPRGGLVEAVLPGRDHEAGDEPLEVPLPRARVRLVEVVEVEDEAPLRARVHPEVREVRVAAGLHALPHRRRGREVARHRGRRAPEEGERRRRHPAHAHRDEVRMAALVRRQNVADRHLGRAQRPPGMAAARHRRAARTAARERVGRRAVRRQRLLGIERHRAPPSRPSPARGPRRRARIIPRLRSARRARGRGRSPR